MSRIYEMQTDEEGDVVNRIVVQVHRAIDEAFPSADAPSKKFAKTVFNNEDTVVEFQRDDRRDQKQQARAEQELFSKHEAVAPSSTPSNLSTTRRVLYLIFLAVIIGSLTAYWIADTLLP